MLQNGFNKVLFATYTKHSNTPDERIHTGETLDLSYSINTEVSLENVECRLWIMEFEGAGLGLDFSSAELELELAPLSSPRLEAEVVEHEFEIIGRNPGLTPVETVPDGSPFRAGLLHVEGHALRKRKVPAPVDGAGLAAHITLPRI